MRDFNEWLIELAFRDFPDDLVVASDTTGTRPYAAEIDDMLRSDAEGIAASAVFCVEQHPTVCIIDGSNLPDDRDLRVQHFRQRVWNQNLASVVLVLHGEYLAALPVNEKDTRPESLPASEAQRTGPWSAYEFQSGFIHDRLPGWFSPEKRVDQRLLTNLRQVVLALSRTGLTSKEAEALIAQVIFLCYLEQRGIIGDAYRGTHGLDTLADYVSSRNGRAIGRLLRQLGQDFNGDFLSSSDGGAPQWTTIPDAAFTPLQDFLAGVDLNTRQSSFWSYDFSEIPVELISGIYETLLTERRGHLGAYYTPRHLAMLVVDQAFDAVGKEPFECTVYDGACGSGILLTTSFRKMLRSAEVHKRRRIRLSDRIALMRKSLFGSDVDETACWITAFSLYLSLLEGLEPADISLLQSDEQVKLPPLVGRDLNLQKGESCGDFFSPRNPFAGRSLFDIFLSNPPWKESEDKETPTWEAWCRRQNPSYPIGRRQIATGFAYRASTSVKEDGVIALIMPLNVVIGATSQSLAFRQRWLADVQFLRIINFADVRRLLFAAAKHPCAVVLARPRRAVPGPIPLAEELVDYWGPKTDVTLALGALSLHAIDRKRLTGKQIYQEPYALISRYWGDRPDVEFLRRLSRFGTLKQTMGQRRSPWLSGKGFHAPNQSNPDRRLGVLSTLKFLPTSQLPDEYPVIANDESLSRVTDLFNKVASPGGKDGKLYRGSRVLFPDGLGDGHVIRAVYTDIPLAFQSSVAAIGGETGDSALLKFLTAYLRSPLASYLLIMTGYSVIGERPRAAVDDLESFPFCAPERHPDPGKARAIVDEVARQFDSLASEPAWLRGGAYGRMRDSLDLAVFEYFGLTESDRLLVDDTVRVIAPSIQPSDHVQIANALTARPTTSDVDRYVRVLSGQLSRSRERLSGNGGIDVRAILDTDSGFFGAVRVATIDGADVTSVETSRLPLRSLVSELQAGMSDQLAQLHEGQLFHIPDIFIFARDTFYFVKPLRRRFWLARTAMVDADRILQTVRDAAWREVNS